MGIGSDIVARLHAPLAAAAAVVTAAAATDFPDRLHSKTQALTPLVLYSAGSVTPIAPAVNGRLDVHGSAMAAAGSGSAAAVAGAAAHCAPAICFYGGVSRAVPASVSGLQRVCARPGVCVPAGHLLPHFQPHGVRFSASFWDSGNYRGPRVEGLGAVRFPVDYPSSVLDPRTLVATAVLSMQVSPSQLPDSVITSSISRYFVTLLASLSSNRYGSSGASSTAKLSMHSWQKPAEPLRVLSAETGSHDKDKPELTVVLLGWLGSSQRHLRRYAEWYTARGIHAVTFVVPIKDIVIFRAGGKAEEHVEVLAQHLVGWLNGKLEGENPSGRERQLLFHTFSNTGWLTYGILLERLLDLDPSLLDKIKGCVVDSAPAAKPDPKIFARGFSAAILAKRSVAVKKAEYKVTDDATKDTSISFPEPSPAEAALLAVLEKFFRFFLTVPQIESRLSEVVTILSKKQPPCPQLYIYSTADRVIPHSLVESFMEQQRQEGRVVRACNLELSPHVDHFRTFPDIYGKQLQNFLQEFIHHPVRDH